MNERKVKKGRRIFLFAFLLTILAFSCGCAYHCAPDHKSPSFHLVVLHTNDTHGHPLKFSFGHMLDVGGLPARATLVHQIRSENENVLLLDAGDLNTGRAESNLFQAEPDLIGYNYLGYDAMVLGNHEFDNPLPILKKQMELARFPFLSANIKTDKGEYLAQPFIIREFDEFSVAIFGLTTRETEVIGNPKHIKGLIFEDEIEVAKSLVPELREKADLVIALVHMGIYGNGRGSKELASKVDGIDLVIDGHSHTLLEKPIIIKNPASKGRTIIVQAGQWGLVVGRVDMWIHDKKMVDFFFETIPINVKTKKYGPIQEDITLLSLLQPYREKAERLLSDTIGHSKGKFDNILTRERETALGDIVADSMLWCAGHLNPRLNPDFALQNGGGIKTDIPEGPITRKTVYELLPYDNSLVALTLCGTDVKSLFEHIAGILPGEGGFPQVSEGVSFTIDHTAGKCESIFINEKPLDPEKKYTIVTNSYLAGGGDGYTIFLKAVDTHDISVSQQEAFIKYIAHLGGKITPQIQGRICVISPDILSFFREILCSTPSVSANSSLL